MPRLFVAFLLLIALGTEAFGQVTPPVPRPPRKGKKYTVTIDSAPQQAAIYLDDKQYGIVGYTPYTGKLVKGDYKLIVELPGYKPAERVIRVDSRNKSFFVPLERQAQPATIDVQAALDPNVIGAAVYVDGKLEGSAPVAIQVPAGRHLVEVKKEGFTPFSQWVDARENERVTMAPALKKTEKPKGSLLVDADVRDAEVWIDGQKHPDPTPTIIDGLEEGPHILEVRKEPAVPWKQTVYVYAGQRTKVTAQLAAGMQESQGGNVRVISNVPGAEVFVDGTSVGKAPLDVKGLPPGIHLIEVRASGYVPKEERVTVNAGQATILKIDLQPQLGGGQAKIKVVSPVPEASVFIDGASVGTVPVEKELPAGEHFIVVQQQGYAKFEQKVSLEPGQTMTITAELRAVGGLRFLSSPQGAEVVLDGEPIGTTPMVKEDVEVGEHVVTIRRAGYYDFEQPVKVEGGKLAIVNADLRAIDTGPTPEDIERMKRGLSSFGARTMPFGRFTADAAVGYPYWLEFRSTVGVKDTSRMGWDVGVGFRSLLTTWEFFLHSRYRYFQRDPFAFAVFGQIGGGGGFDGRNMFTFQAGLLNSITFRNLVTVTGRAYLDLWSDRLCGLPEEGSMRTLPEDGPRVCLEGAPPELLMRASQLLGETIDSPEDLQARDNGVRFYLSAIVEAAVTKRFNAFLVFEGAPFQDERAAFTDLFNSTLFEEDPIYAGKLGITAKF